MTCIHRDVFPLGVPQQFSFIATFCSKVAIRTQQWHLIKITDYENNTNLQITMNEIDGMTEILFSIVNYDGYLQTVVFVARNVSYLN